MNFAVPRRSKLHGASRQVLVDQPEEPRRLKTCAQHCLDCLGPPLAFGVTDVNASATAARPLKAPAGPQELLHLSLSSKLFETTR